MGTTVDDHGINLSNSGSKVGYEGFKFLTKTACTLTKVTKHASCTAPYCVLSNSSYGFLASGAFVGNDCTFSYDLSDATNYIVEGGGGSYTRRWGSCIGLIPIAGTNVNFITGSDAGNNEPNNFYNLQSLTTTTSDATGAQINIGDVWKSSPKTFINIGDTWKECSGDIKIQIGGTWKTV